MTSIGDIGQHLIDERIAQGLSQRELACRLGIHQQQVARWERERYGCVSLARLRRVAEMLGLADTPLLLATDKGVDSLPLMAAEEPARYATAVLEPPELQADDNAQGSAVEPVRDLGEIVARVRAHADELAERFGVTCIEVYGSFARGEQTAKSDVDLIVEVAEPTLESVFGSERRLQEILGRSTQAGSLRAVNARVRKNVEEDLVRVWPTQ